MDTVKLACIDRLARRIIDVPYDGNIALNKTEWDWPSGVGMYGLLCAWRYTGNPCYVDFLQSWIDERLGQAFRLKNVNTTAPLLTVLELYTTTGQEEYMKACRYTADWMIESAAYTREGALEHTVSDPEHRFSEQMWADTLFMACLFLARMSAITGSAAYREEAIKQLAIHVKHLQDPDTGLFFHAWNSDLGHWMSGARWGRANAWMLAAGMEMLDLLPDFEGRDEIIGVYIRQAEALQRMQRDNGMYGTLLDHADSYDEASATAGIAYGMKRGVRSGLLPDRFLAVVEKAEKAVLERINERGELEQVSHGTDVKRDLEAYKQVPIVPAFWGQGLALLLLCQK